MVLLLHLRKEPLSKRRCTFEADLPMADCDSFASSLHCGGQELPWFLDLLIQRWPTGLWLSLSPNGWCRYGTDLLRHWFLSLMKTTCSFRVADFHTTLYLKGANFSSDTEIVHRIVDRALWGRLLGQNSHRLERCFCTFGRFSRSSRLLKFPLDGSSSFRRASWWRKGSLFHLSQTQSLFSWGFSGLQTHDDTKTEEHETRRFSSGTAAWWVNKLHLFWAWPGLLFLLLFCAWCFACLLAWAV